MERIIQAEENVRRRMAEDAEKAAEKVLRDAQRKEKFKIQQDKLHKSFLAENKDVARELMFTGMKLRSPNERVRMAQWMKKLSEMQTNEKSARRDLFISNQYINYLRVTLQGEYQVLTKPFNVSPPDELIHLEDCLANKVADSIPDVPRAGALQPVLCHKSDDDRAYMCVKQTADKGILVYMACAPDASAMKHPQD